MVKTNPGNGSASPASRLEASVSAPQRAIYRPVSRRALLLGLTLIPLNMVWIARMEKVDGRAFSSTASLFFTAIFSLLLLTGVNALARRIRPHFALRQGELLVVYAMLCIATAIAGADLLQQLVCIMAYAHWYATPENNWRAAFARYFPHWLVVDDRAALAGFYQGNSSLYQGAALRVWLPPLACWTLFLLVLLWVMACLNTLIRAQWAERERLPYPMIQLPIAMTSEDGSVYRSRLFRFGFAVAGGLNLLNGLHFLFPNVPGVSLSGFDGLSFHGVDVGQWFASPPWNAIGWTPLSFFPCMVGLGYLLPVDMLFSCWFFFLIWRLEKVAGSALGHGAESSRFPYVDEQMFGAGLAVCLFVLWTARGHLREVWRAAIRNPKTEFQNPDAPMSARAALLGAITGLLFLIGFFVLAGLPIWLSFLFVMIYFVISLIITRMRAELGPPVHDLLNIGPAQPLVTLFGGRNLSPQALAVFGLSYWFTWGHRSHPMPHQLEGFRMAQISRTSSRGMLAAMGIAALGGIVATFWITLHESYRLGTATVFRSWTAVGFGDMASSRITGWIGAAARPDAPGIGAMGMGFLIATGLTLLKLHFYGWPFHPLGFLISGTWSMMWVWPSLFVAWVCKALILRYSGLKGYRAGLPFFFGVILGDFVLGGLWTLLGLALDIPTYNFWRG